ncbi:hypothetical protein F0344_25740 [Streptomyces finlayi]|uniref:Uncharacterized protein n=1 Tax=Streptomyces finlayi TaxID=67296 RepID=A0A7G7BQD0_9ACTN|nr:hypothetical protein [Streptomyces finlayi]QNE77545.1 hypothetical protein F0344_25740 [Streptomyces finlayi]
MATYVEAWDLSHGKLESFNVDFEDEPDGRKGVSREELISLVRERDGILRVNRAAGLGWSGAGGAGPREGGFGRGDHMTLPGVPDLGGIAVRCPTSGCGFSGLTWTWDTQSPPTCPWDATALERA